MIAAFVVCAACLLFLIVNGQRRGSRPMHAAVAALAVFMIVGLTFLAVQ